MKNYIINNNRQDERNQDKKNEFILNAQKQDELRHIIANREQSM